MTDENDDKPTGPDDDAMRSLLKRSLAKEKPGRPVLLEVQRKLRERSRGKFYADGWSTTTQSRMSYALIAVAMLLIVAIAILILGPMGFTK